jgi:DNA repair protein RecN (Recombination protein N)
MLQQLYIKNFALIKEVNILFTNGLQVITGETGAGKSIIIGALSTLLGERFETNKLLLETEKCIVEGHFDVANNLEVLKFLKENDFEQEHQLVLRRELLPSGKSRTFINDTPASLQQMQVLGGFLVDLHRQFDTLSLVHETFQINVLDALAHHKKELLAYKETYTKYKQAKSNLTQLQQQQQQLKTEQDFLQFIYKELEQAAFKNNEIEEAEAQLKLLNSAEFIAQNLNAIVQGMQEGEQPLLASIKQYNNQLQGLVKHAPFLQSLQERLQAAYSELQDITASLEEAQQKVEFNQEQFDALTERVDLGYKLLKKHNKKNTEELIEFTTNTEAQLQLVNNIDDAVAKAVAQLNQLEKDAIALGQKISEGRNKTTAGFVKKLQQLLQQVGMPNAALKVEITQGELNAYGIDSVQFLFDANKTGKWNSIKKVASGGELSRLMLCIKSLVANNMELPTLIFDEIDTGISGEACKQVGIIMQQMATNKQLICITHQPQIAAKGDRHLFIYKSQNTTPIQTQIKELTTNDRVLHIAQMIGGANPSEAVIQNATEMLEQ